jgi:L-rhamnose mutarotase
MKRVASVIGLKPENRDEYEKLHRNVWPEVLKQISKSNIRNYSIFRYGNLLFSYFEYVGENYELDMKLMSEDQATQRWWEVCGPMQSPVEIRKDGEWWSEIPEVFHID